METNLWVCLKCGFFNKGTPANVTETCLEHMCEIVVNRKKNIDDCKKILDIAASKQPIHQGPIRGNYYFKIQYFRFRFSHY